jgi:hypothetical protein
LNKKHLPYKEEIIDWKELKRGDDVIVESREKIEGKQEFTARRIILISETLESPGFP